MGRYGPPNFAIPWQDSVSCRILTGDGILADRHQPHTCAYFFVPDVPVGPGCVGDGFACGATGWVVAS
jgi:hypothetical protein